MKKQEKRGSIRNWLPEERPRERLLRLGGPSLSDAELLAVILGSGSDSHSAVDLARHLLLEGGGTFPGLYKVGPQRLLTLRGVGPAKAAGVQAAMEIASRFGLQPPGERPRIRESADAFRVLQPILSHLDHEEFWVLYLNNANRVLSSFQLSKGGLTGTLVDVRLLLRKALELSAVALVLAHNHPSGNLRPSKADQQITRKIEKASRAMDIRVLDHLILGGTAYFSFADEHMM